LTRLLSIDIRAARQADAPRLAELSGVLGYPASPEVFAVRLERVLAHSAEQVFVAETSPGLIAGWIHAAEQCLLETDPRCEILGLVVDASYRQLGVGRQLIAAAEAWARQRGLDEMSVRSNVLRAESHPFYERLGYTRVKTQHAYRKHLV
jgi:GNAT superfamily N-acetyltransferase